MVAVVESVIEAHSGECLTIEGGTVDDLVAGAWLGSMDSSGDLC